MSDWRPSETNPGYIEKTIKSGVATIRILRPKLSEEEREARIKTACATLESVMRKRYQTNT